MKHKGYEGVAQFDEEAHIFHGEVINTSDVITFQGTTVNELEQAFRDSVDDYLEFCATRSEEPALSSLREAPNFNSERDMPLSSGN